MSININDFVKRYQKEYAFLYKNDYVAGEEEAVKAFDKFAPKHKDFIMDFVNHTGDFISSDREAAAFMFALEGEI